MKKKIRNEKRRQGIWTANRQRILFVSEGKKETVRENKKETECGMKQMPATYCDKREIKAQAMNPES